MPSFINAQTFYHIYNLLYCSKSTDLSTTSVSDLMSIILFATVCTSSWSCEVNKILPRKACMPLFNAVILSRSKWFVGSSKMSTLPLPSIIFANIHLTFRHQKALLLVSKPIRQKTAFCQAKNEYKFRFGRLNIALTNPKG